MNHNTPKEYAIDTGSAMPEASTAQTAESFANLPLACIVSSLTNPRKTFNPERLAELAESIKASGVHQAILVRPLPAHRVSETGRKITHEVVAGERRFRASVMAQVLTIPATIKDLTDAQVLEIQIIENLQREDLTALEEAQGYQQLCDATGIAKEDIGAKIGKSRRYVYARIKLLDLSQAGQQALRAGEIDVSVAEQIARIPDQQLQEKALEQALEEEYDGGKMYSARSFSAMVQEHYMLTLERAVFTITDATLLPDAGSCKTCHKRTGHAPDLFSDVKGADVCTDPPCFHKKEDAYHARLMSDAHARGQTVIAGREAKELMPTAYSDIKGFLRLDDKRDSPTDQPLRKLLGKHLTASEVQPTLILSPHQKNQLIAVLPLDVVSQLLKDAGQASAAKEVVTSGKQEMVALQKREERDLKDKYEQAWRNEVMAVTWHKMAHKEVDSVLPPAIARIIALRYLNNLNPDKSRLLCKILGLDKVAPKDTLFQHIETTPRITDLVHLLVMEADSHYASWLPDSKVSYAGLIQTAEQFGISIDNVKSAVKAEFSDKVKAKEKPKTAPDKGPAALRKDQLDAAAKKPKQARPARAKMTAQEAQLGIAEAMQKDEAASPQVTSSTVAVGSKVKVTSEEGGVLRSPHPKPWPWRSEVKVTSEEDGVGPIAGKFAGKVGTVSNIDPDFKICTVKFGRGSARFMIEQLELCADQAEVPA